MDLLALLNRILIIPNLVDFLTLSFITLIIKLLMETTYLAFI